MQTVQFAKQIASKSSHHGMILKCCKLQIHCSGQSYFKNAFAEVSCNIIKTKNQMDLSQNKSQRRVNPQRKDLVDGYESDYSPQIQISYTKRVKNSGKKVQTKRKQHFNNSTWNLEENLLYKDFIKKNYNLFNLERQQRRAIKINVLISKFVKTRTSDQCRSHHQKMLIYHHDLDSIVDYIETLQSKREEPKMSQPVQPEEPETMNTPNLEMKEIQDVKTASPSLWDFMVREFGNTTTDII